LELRGKQIRERYRRLVKSQSISEVKTMTHFKHVKKDVDTPSLFYIIEYEAPIPLHSIEDLSGGISQLNEEFLNVLGLFTQTHHIDISVLSLQSPMCGTRTTKANCHTAEESKRNAPFFRFFNDSLCFFDYVLERRSSHRN
jgi:hypothetical protein